MKVSARVVLLVLALILLAGVGVAVWVGYVRVQYGEWGLGPSDSPPRLSFEGRTYRRGGSSAAVPAGDVVVGHVGDGDLYGPARRPDAPTVLELRTADGVIDYALSGGP